MTRMFALTLQLPFSRARPPVRAAQTGKRRAWDCAPYLTLACRARIADAKHLYP